MSVFLIKILLNDWLLLKEKYYECLGELKYIEIRESCIIKNYVAVWRFRYTLICQSKSVELVWSC